MAFEAVKNSSLLYATTNDDKEYCPKGMSVYNWTLLLSAMAKYESSFKPETEYVEKFKDQKGKFIISTGLLQLSQESARGYGCDAKSQEWLKDPKNNIECAVRILEKWVIKDSVIASKKEPWLGGARYWSVLRYKADKIKSDMKGLCK
jgi:hypothetical protein